MYAENTNIHSAYCIKIEEVSPCAAQTSGSTKNVPNVVYPNAYMQLVQRYVCRW